MSFGVKGGTNKKMERHKEQTKGGQRNDRGEVNRQIPELQRDWERNKKLRKKSEPCKSCQEQQQNPKKGCRKKRKGTSGLKPNPHSPIRNNNKTDAKKETRQKGGL